MKWIARCLTALVLFLVPTIAFADALKVPFVFSDHMVLQQELADPIWGQASPGATVEVTFASQKKQATADASGNWSLKLDPMPASTEAREIHISSSGESLAIADVLVGEVWVCSGQSNMEKPVGLQRGQKPTIDFEKEIAAANYPQIRLMQVAKTGDPEIVAKSRWQVCTPTSLDESHFSAVGYFFSRKIHNDLKVPVGMIHSSWGGTGIEPWTPTEAFDQFETLKKYAAVARKRGPTTQGANTAASGLYNAMIKPLVPFGVRGALWYQGEHNATIRDRAKYTEKMQALVGGWRTAWGEGDFPFYYVQLAPWKYGSPKSHMNEQELPAIWEAQRNAMKVIPNTGMAVTTDLVDDLNDIHPPKKKEVGERLALWALADTYHKPGIVRSGPLYKSAEFKDGKAILHFDEIGSGLASRDGAKLTDFTIAGDDHTFVSAEAQIEGDTLVVSASSIAKPQAVRFGWNETAMPNFANKEGLPASPFRTDDWEIPLSPPAEPASKPATAPVAR